MKDDTVLSEFAADESDLRRRLRDYAGRAVPGTDTWDKLQARIADPRKRSAASPRRPLIAAVAAALIAVIAVLNVMGREDDSVVDIIENTTTTTESETSSTTTEDVTTTTSGDEPAATTTPPSAETDTGPGVAPPDDRGRTTGTGPGSSDQPDGGASGPGTSSTSTPDTTTTSSEPEDPQRQLVVINPVVTLDETVQVQPVVGRPPDTHIRAELYLDGVRRSNFTIQYFGPGVPPGEGMFRWFQRVMPDQALGVYTLRLWCEYYDEEAGSYVDLFQYEEVTYTVVAPAG